MVVVVVEGDFDVLFTLCLPLLARFNKLFFGVEDALPEYPFFKFPFSLIRSNSSSSLSSSSSIADRLNLVANSTADWGVVELSKTAIGVGEGDNEDDDDFALLWGGEEDEDDDDFALLWGGEEDDEEEEATFRPIKVLSSRGVADDVDRADADA